MLAFLFRLARFVLLVVALRYLIAWLFSIARSRTSPFFPKPSPSEVRDPAVVVEARRDPVCGTFVSTELSVKASVGGIEQHFCSNECRDKWMEASRLRVVDRTSPGSAVPKSK